jgi:hypothetical protein
VNALQLKKNRRQYIMANLAYDDKATDGSLHEKDAHVGTSEEIHIDPVAEKRLIRKLDLILSPMMVTIFLVAYLDRSNIGRWSILNTNSV